MYGDDAYIQPQAVGRERYVDLVQPRAVVQVEPAIDRGRCQLRRRASSDLLTCDTRVAARRGSPVEQHLRDRQRCDMRTITVGVGARTSIGA